MRRSPDSALASPVHEQTSRWTRQHLYFCDAVDGYYTDVVEKGAAIQAPAKYYEYGMPDFVIEDPDGNLIGVGQETRATD